MEYSFLMSADAYVDEDMPDSNFGADSELSIGTTNGEPFEAYGYFGFNIGGIPQEAVITGVKFECSIEDTNTGGTLSFHVVTGTWNEYTVTWNNKPAVGAYAGSGDMLYSSEWQGRIDTPGLISVVNALRPSGYLSLRAEYSGLRMCMLSGTEKLIVVCDSSIRKIAPVQGVISKSVLSMRAAVNRGAINNAVKGMKIAPVQGPINKTVF